MIIDFYKAIYRLLKSGLFSPLGAGTEEFSEVGIVFSFPHHHSQNLQTSEFFGWCGFFCRVGLLLFGLFLFFCPQDIFVVDDAAVLQCRINPSYSLPPETDFFFHDLFLKYIACQIFIHCSRLVGWMLSRVGFMSENQQLLIYHTGH